MSLRTWRIMMFVVIRYLKKDKVREEYHMIKDVNVEVDDLILDDGDPVEILKVKLKRHDGTIKICYDVSDIEVL